MRFPWRASTPASITGFPTIVGKEMGKKIGELAVATRYACREHRCTAPLTPPTCRT